MSDKKNIKSISSSSGIQNNFINRLKKVLPPTIGIAEEISDLLNISIDSAYRRIRGETDFTFEEIYIITRKHKISIDEIYGNSNDSVTFEYIKLTDSEANFEKYLTSLRNRLESINKVEEKNIYYVAEDIPVFYSFFSKKLTEFKLFYWQKSVLNVPQYQKVNFEFGKIPKKLVEIAQESYHVFLNIPSIEIWSEGTIYTGLRQIKFYFDTGILNKIDALELLNEYKKMIEMVQKFAEDGRKNNNDSKNNFTLYSSEVVLGTNCIYITMGNSKYAYISFNTMNSLTTNNTEFCEETEHWVHNLERKSNLISGVSEAQRYQFFNTMFKSIDSFIDKISHA